MVQIKVSHLLGAVFTIVMSVAGSAFTIYSETTSNIQKNSEEIDHVKEIFELKLEPVKDNQKEIILQLKEIQKTLNANPNQ